MTCVGLDVHARSTQAAAIDLMSGELRRARFGVGSEEVVGWLVELPGPVRVAYEAGPTGFGLARAAEAAGVDVMGVAPSKTPRARGDRVKSDRKDAELLARLLLAGQLRPVTIPPDWLESIRHLARTREGVSPRSRPRSPPGLEAAVARGARLSGQDDLEPRPSPLAFGPAVRL
ncbi:MAG: IS110 family transposase [Thermoleophilaceae bacterium]